MKGRVQKRHLRTPSFQNHHLKGNILPLSDLPHHSLEQLLNQSTPSHCGFQGVQYGHISNTGCHSLICVHEWNQCYMHPGDLGIIKHQIIAHSGARASRTQHRICSLFHTSLALCSPFVVLSHRPEHCQKKPTQVLPRHVYCLHPSLTTL